MKLHLEKLQQMHLTVKDFIEPVLDDEIKAQEDLLLHDKIFKIHTVQPDQYEESPVIRARRRMSQDAVQASRRMSRQDVNIF